MQIAIDGPAGAGKSTVARAAAGKLGFLYVDTGAMYRAVGVYLLDRGIDVHSGADTAAAVKDAGIGLFLADDGQHVTVDGEDLTGRIRTEEAGMTASLVSTYLPVREKLVRAQQEIAASQDIVMDGRDIGTVVLPDAELKIYLTASVEARAQRRFLELREKGQDPDLKLIEEDIRSRDEQDMNRAHSPLRRAEDAVLIDSSDMTADEVTDRILRLAGERRKA